MIRRAQPWLGTLVEISVAAEPHPRIDAAIALAFAEIALVHRLMSFHDPASDVSRLNRAGVGELLAIDPHTWEVLALAEALAEASDGAFDVGCGLPLVRWQMLPAPQAPAPAYRPGVPVFACASGHRVKKLADGWIDLGGIAKGYAVDLAVQALGKAGAGEVCVNAGGDMRAAGAHAFPVVLRAARDPGRLGPAFALREQALATSANYFSRKPWEQGTVSALVDGRDGTPLLEPASASVWAQRCAVADGLTKVVLATRDSLHPALAVFGAHARLTLAEPL